MIRRLFTVAILTVVFVVAAIVVGADIGGRVLAEHQIATRAKASTHAQTASSSISSFPFIYNFAFAGTIDHVTIHLTRVPVGPLTIDKVDLKANGIRINRSYLVNHQKVRVESIASADAKLTLTAGDISAASGVQVSIAGNAVTALVGGASVPVNVAIAGGHTLTLGLAGGQGFSFDIDRSPIIPPCAMQLATVNDSLTLQCAVSPVPQPVVAAISGS